MSKLADKIRLLIEQESPAYGLFLVGENIAPGNIHLVFYLDSAEPLNMQVLTEFSRHINKMVDEGDFGDKKFTLEFSSPGADRPLAVIQQFPKHIGRTFEIATKTGDKLEGILLRVEGELLVFQPLEKKKNKFAKPEASSTAESIPINFADIETASIKIAFK